MLHPDPFRDIDRLTAQLLGASPGSARVPLAMPMDLYRSGDHYVLHADLPGVDPDSVDVSIDGGVLTVTAQRSERTEHDVQWLNSERFTGGYMRRLSLGQDIDADHIAATYQNGVLTVTSPWRQGPSRATSRSPQGHARKQRSSSPATHPTSTPRPNPSSPDGVQAGHAAGPGSW